MRLVLLYLAMLPACLSTDAPVAPAPPPPVVARPALDALDEEDVAWVLREAERYQAVRPYTDAERRELVDQLTRVRRFEALDRTAPMPAAEEPR